MRIDVKKFLFYGSEKVLKPFFVQAQEAGLIHFIEESVQPKEVPQKINDALQAIKILRSLPVLPQEELESVNEANGLVEEILSLKHAIEKLTEEERVNRLEIERIRPFGDFSFDDVRYIEEHGKRKIEFFFSKKGAFDELPEGLIYVNSDHGLDYFVSIEKKEFQMDGLVQMHFEASLLNLSEKKERIKKEIIEKEQKLKSFQKYNTFLHIALTEEWNEFALKSAQKHASFLMDGKIFAVAGWVPKNKINELKTLIGHTDAQMEEIAIEETDQIPTYLENEGLSRIGQDVIQVYDIPSSNDKDPSLWVLVFFAIFFSMIIGDGGYGLIFLAVACYLRYKTASPTPLAKRLLNLFTILCAFCIGWGVLANSFFGVSLSMDNPITKFSLVQWLIEKKAEYHIAKQDSVFNYWVQKYPNLQGVQNPVDFLKGAKKPNGDLEMLSTFQSNIMMELALLIGSLHIILSFFRYARRNYPAIGWILFIIGGYFYLPEYLKGTSILHFAFGLDKNFLALEGKVLMAIGFPLAILLSFIQNKWKGALEVMNVIQIFSDILSYLRLYALGLAGAIISVIINDATTKIPFLGIFVFLFGHSLNMVLAVMGGVIHGLRLNFIEWYHYSFEGGGKLFSPLKKQSRRTT
jgi:V/A-type H+-transporting ATPase subunit I